METFLRQRHTIDVTKALLTRLFELCRERHPDAPPLTGTLPVRVFLTARMLLHNIDRPLLDDIDILPVFRRLHSGCSVVPLWGS